MKDKEIKIMVTAYLRIKVKGGVDPEEVISEMGYGFTSNTEGAIVVHEELLEWDIKEE